MLVSSLAEPSDWRRLLRAQCHAGLGLRRAATSSGSTSRRVGFAPRSCQRCFLWIRRRAGFSLPSAGRQKLSFVGKSFTYLLFLLLVVLVATQAFLTAGHLFLLFFDALFGEVQHLVCFV